MRIPRINIRFTDYITETDKAYLLVINGSEVWLPKSIVSDFKVDKNRFSGSLNIAPFKYTEITGIVPQHLNSLEIMESNHAEDELIDYDIIEPKGIYLKDKQIDVVSKCKRLKSFLIYGEMRTGKTVIATTIAVSRMKQGICNKIVVIAPLRTSAVWDSHLWEVGFKFIPTEHFSNIHTRNNINLDCDDDTFVILDESHQIKNKSALRTELIIKETECAGQKCILTGTPIGKHAGDLFFQFYFLNPNILNYHSYSDFESQHLLYGGREGKTVVAYTNIEEISNRISPYTAIINRADVGIDREKIYETEGYIINNRDDYDFLNSVFEKNFEESRGDAVLGSLVKLQQCANGRVFNSNLEVSGVIDNGRINCLSNLLHKNKGQRIVIYYKYNDDLDLLKCVDVPILNGKLGLDKFNAYIDDFNNGSLEIIALQQQLSIGFSLRSADIMIYFSRKFGSINSAQSEDRACERVDKPLRIIDIVAKDTVDEWIKSKIKTQKEIINLIKSKTNESRHGH